MRRKLVVTARNLYGEESLIKALEAQELNPKRTGFRAVLLVETDKDIFDVAREITRKLEVGRAVPVIEESESKYLSVEESAIGIALEYIKEDDSFCFRVHKRGAHNIDMATPEFEYKVGSAIYEALEKKYNKKPIVNLKLPDITITAEVLGKTTYVGILKRIWKLEQ